MSLFNELAERTGDLQEALENQTAVSDALRVISQSGTELTPVLRTLVETAARICDGANAFLYRLVGDRLQLAAAFGISQEHAQFVAANPPAITRGTLAGRTVLEQRVLQMEDALTDPEYTYTESAQRGHFRTQLGVPLVREGELIGVLCFARSRVELFTEKQVELIRTFANQAVIAMENARLITELRDRTRDLQESLEYQTATADLLKIVSRSTFDLQPVLENLAESATRLCEADFGIIHRQQGDAYRLVASHRLPEAARASLEGHPLRPGRGSTTGRALLIGKIVHIEDVAADPEYEFPHASRYISYGTTLAVPLLRNNVAAGVITLVRKAVKPFSERQIELVRSFADQAVIAIENARLLDEIRQRQTELRVTFDNMADGVAMFDAGLHLAAWNRNFQELLDLPDPFLAGPRSFDDYIRYLTERGEFGETSPEAQIARLRARFGEHYTFERGRPDGRVLEVRHNPMPDGGFVLIYGDITERKRSEEEIRAARDAAEDALQSLKAAQANLIQAEKMASLGQLTAGIAHEIKNPLNFVNNFASLSIELLAELRETAAPALETLSGDRRVEVDEMVTMLTGNLDKIGEHGRRADNIVKSMLEHSRGVTGERRQVDLNALIDDALNLAYHGARAQNQSFDITLERDYAEALKPIELAPQEMTRVFLNLVGNGFYAANKRARDNGDRSYRPALTVRTREAGDAVEVRVRDNGSGIPADIRDKLFQPFFTTKPTGEGTGLGLSISYDIVTQQHGGAITVESEPGSYTEFTIRLPRR